MIEDAFKFDGETIAAANPRSVRLEATNIAGARVVTLRVSLFTGGAASIRPIAQATVLDLEFRKTEYDAFGSSSPAPLGTKSNHGVGALVTLDTPREIVRIRMAGGADALMRSAQISLHRVDRDAASEEPTVRASPSPVGTFVIPAGFVDRRFVIKTTAAGTLSAAAVSEVMVRSFPTGPRVRLSSPAVSLEPALVWSAPGEFDRAPDSSMLSAPIGAAFADVLARHLAGLSGPLPEVVHVDVHIESDAPCDVLVKRCEVAYALESRVPVDGGKIVLRFPGGAETSRTIDVPIPASATVTRAEIEAVESFAGSTASAPPSTNGSTLGTLHQTRGIEIAAGHKGGVFMPTTAPLRIAGTAIAIVALSQSTTAEASIHGGDLETGANEVLAAAILRPVGRSWVTALFGKPVIVQPPGAWVMVTVRNGVLAWLAEDDQSHHALLAGERESLQRGRIIRGVKPLVVLLPVRDESAPDANGAMQVRIAEHDVTRTATSNRGDVVYDATAALVAHLGAAGSTSRTARVQFTTPLRGIITVDRVALEYDLP